MGLRQVDALGACIARVQRHIQISSRSWKLGGWLHVAILWSWLDCRETTRGCKTCCVHIATFNVNGSCVSVFVHVSGLAETTSWMERLDRPRRPTRVGYRLLTMPAASTWGVGCDTPPIVITAGRRLGLYATAMSARYEYVWPVDVGRAANIKPRPLAFIKIMHRQIDKWLGKLSCLAGKWQAVYIK